MAFLADSPEADLSVISDDLFAAVRENDALTSIVVFRIIVVQGLAKESEILSLTKRLFDYTLNQSRVGLYATGFLAAIGQVGLQPLVIDPVIDDDFYILYERMLVDYLDKTKGMFYSNLSVAHKNILLGEHVQMRKARRNLNDKDLHAHYLEQAVQEQDWQFLDLLLFDVALQATVYESPEIALRSITVILSSPYEYVKNAVVDLLVRVRLYYPDLVGDFLEENELDDETRQLVNKRIVVEPFWGNFMQKKFNWMLVKAMQDTTIRREAANLLAKAPQCRDLAEFTEFAIKRAVNLIYGEPVFPE